MLLDQTRRDVADKLRYTARDGSNNPMGDLKRILDVEEGSYRDVFRKMAKLIDRPRCRPVADVDQFGDTWVSCSECGEPLVVNPCVKPAAYYPRCMGCGAEVVDER